MAVVARASTAVICVYSMVAMRCFPALPKIQIYSFQKTVRKTKSPYLQATSYRLLYKLHMPCLGRMQNPGLSPVTLNLPFKKGKSQFDLHGLHITPAKRPRILHCGEVVSKSRGTTSVQSNWDRVLNSRGMELFRWRERRISYRRSSKATRVSYIQRQDTDRSGFGQKGVFV